MTINRYPLGKTVRVFGDFTDDSAAAIDPSTVTFKYRAPGATAESKTLVAGEVTKDSAGTYYFDLDLSTAGRWFYRWESTGPKTAVEGELVVASSRVD